MHMFQQRTGSTLLAKFYLVSAREYDAKECTASPFSGGAVNCMLVCGCCVCMYERYVSLVTGCFVLVAY